VRSANSRQTFWARLSNGFLTSEHGTAGVELALFLPPALILLALAVMAGEGFELQRKALLAARTITDLVSQAPYVQDPPVPGATLLNQSDLDTDLALSSEIMWPNSTSSLQVVVSELSVNAANKTGTVVWSEPYPAGASPLPIGMVINLSPDLVSAGATYLIYGQVQYTFAPLNIYQLVGPITLNEADTLVPRNAAQIAINYGQ
jgi:hypothetical protein